MPEPLQRTADVPKFFIDNSGANPCGGDTLQAEKASWPPAEELAELSPCTVILDELNIGKVKL